MPEPMFIVSVAIAHAADRVARAGLAPHQEPLISIPGYGDDVYAFCLIRAPFGHHAHCPWVDLMARLSRPGESPN